MNEEIEVVWILSSDGGEKTWIAGDEGREPFVFATAEGARHFVEQCRLEAEPSSLGWETLLRAAAYDSDDVNDDEYRPQDDGDTAEERATHVRLDFGKLLEHSERSERIAPWKFFYLPNWKYMAHTENPDADASVHPARVQVFRSLLEDDGWKAGVWALIDGEVNTIKSGHDGPIIFSSGGSAYHFKHLLGSAGDDPYLLSWRQFFRAVKGQKWAAVYMPAQPFDQQLYIDLEKIPVSEIERAYGFYVEMKGQAPALGEELAALEGMAIGNGGAAEWIFEPAPAREGALGPYARVVPEQPIGGS